MIETVIGPVHIGVPNDFRLPHSIHDATTRAPSEVSHNMLDSIDVVWTERGSEWREGPDSGTYVRVSPHSGIG